MPSEILVTGGAGFIGSNLVDRLLKIDCRVTVFDNFNDFYNPDIKRNNIKDHLKADNYTLVEGDLRDSNAVNQLFEQTRFDEVIHLAAMAGVRPSIERPVLYQEVNLIGTMNILEAMRRHELKKLIFASSSSVYGNNEKVPFSESDPVDNPISPYASTKKSGELMVYTYHHLYQIKAACLRFFTVYGPRQRPEMAIHLFTDLIHNDKPIKMFGDGQSQRDYTFVDDIVEGIISCRRFNYDYEIFNLGRSDTVKLSELIEKISSALGKKADIKRLEQQKGDVNRTFADITKARKILNFEPKISIDEGIKRFVDWYLNNRKVF